MGWHPENTVLLLYGVYRNGNKKKTWEIKGEHFKVSQTKVDECQNKRMRRTRIIIIQVSALYGQLISFIAHLIVLGQESCDRRVALLTSVSMTQYLFVLFNVLQKTGTTGIPCNFQLSAKETYLVYIQMCSDVKFMSLGGTHLKFHGFSWYKAFSLILARVAVWRFVLIPACKPEQHQWV